MVDRILKPKIAECPKSCLLLGPRQVGKSTLLESLNPDFTFNLARESEYHLFVSQPGRLEQIVEASSPSTVFIDEVQRIPSLLNSVQALVDQAKGRLKFYLSGSSARKLRRGQANLLPGRVIQFHLGGLCGDEIPKKIPIEKLLKFGTLPEIITNTDEEFCASLLESYAGGYLREEIQAESLVHNVQGFSRFLIEAGISSGQILDFSKLAKRAKISRTSCVRFFEILEDTLLVNRCDVFSNVEHEKPIKHPKFFLFDNGVRNALTESFDLAPERKGLIFEHFIYNQIKNSIMAHSRKADIRYFRTHSGFEIDFVVSQGQDIWAIEVKTGHITEDDLIPLKRFKNSVKAANCLAVGLRETQPRKASGVLICDWRTMLSELGF